MKLSYSGCLLLFQVGACIVNEDKIIVGIGYNSMPYLNSRVPAGEEGAQNDDMYPWERKDGPKPEIDTETKYPYGNHFWCTSCSRTNPLLIVKKTQFKTP